MYVAYNMYVYVRLSAIIFMKLKIYLFIFIMKITVCENFYFYKNNRTYQIILINSPSTVVLK